MQIERHVLYLSGPHAGPLDKADPNKTSSESFGSMEEHEIPVSSGYYFPEIVLFQTICDRRYVYSDIYDRNFNLKLTSEAIGNIPIGNILKIKLYANKIPDRIDLKLQTESREYHFYIPEKDIFPLFSKLLWLKLATMNIFTDQIGDTEENISGVIIKKCEGFSSKWEEVSLKISRKDGFQLFNSNHSIAKAQKLKEFWTRLEVVEKEEYLVVKTFVGFSKYELGIPVKKRLMSWIQAFCNLLTA